MKLIALIGKAGSGKDTILRKVVELYSDKFQEIVSCTTRSPRENEQNGINYYFLTEEQFKNKIINNDMLEFTLFNNWFYGTSFSELSKDKINIGVFNPEGVQKLLNYSFIDLSVYYIQATDKNRLLRQLTREENPDVKEIIRRFSTDEKDFEHINRYLNYDIIYNNTICELESAITTIGQIR